MAAHKPKQYWPRELEQVPMKVLSCIGICRAWKSGPVNFLSHAEASAQPPLDVSFLLWAQHRVGHFRQVPKGVEASVI